MPAMIMLGFGAGIAFNPVLLAAMSDVAPEEAGLASGVVNTSFMMGGALGLAVLASVAASRTDSLEAAGRRRWRRSTAATTSRSSSAPSSPQRRPRWPASSSAVPRRRHAIRTHAIEPATRGD